MSDDYQGIHFHEDVERIARAARLLAEELEDSPTSMLAVEALQCFTRAVATPRLTVLAAAMLDGVPLQELGDAVGYSAPGVTAVVAKHPALAPYAVSKNGAAPRMTKDGIARAAGDLALDD